MSNFFAEKTMSYKKHSDFTTRKQNWNVQPTRAYEPQYDLDG